MKNYQFLFENLFEILQILLHYKNTYDYAYQSTDTILFLDNSFAHVIVLIYMIANNKNPFYGIEQKRTRSNTGVQCMRQLREPIPSHVLLPGHIPFPEYL